ncbi:MAG TPA: NAD(P)/FAD-dependent oxidoreductase [Spirochaetota bacterium]|nr:NAD(P)/FAD-dependent oxidoreductase [Spirochaetota bacterium]
MKLKLENGSSVYIVGGGPAGSFAAIHLLRYAEEHNLMLEVFIFEFRNGANSGPAGCKGCAGVLSSTLLKNLSSIGIDIPGPLILDKLKSYVLHLPNIGGDVIIVNQPDPERNIFSISRGNGPRISPSGPTVSFDDFLREQAIIRGAKLISSRVRTIEWGEHRPVVITNGDSYPADFLVLATGVNSHTVLSPYFKYEPPETVIMVQDEFVKPDKLPDDTVAAFFDEPWDIFFGTMVPKGKYMNVSLFGRNWKRVRKDAVKKFMSSEAVRMGELFTVTPENLCGCMPRIVVKPARKYYGDRWVAVGDAAVSRLYKDGIGSAYLTSSMAMHSALTHGISESDFKKDYRKLCRSLSHDNFIGSIMFRIFSWMLEKPFIARSISRCVHEEMSLPPARRVFTILIWGMLTGDYSYRFLLGKLFSMRGTVRFIKNFIIRHTM